jgi:hypothetical protein
VTTPPLANPTLQDVIDQLLAELAGYEGHTDEYGKIVAQLDKLYKMKALSNEHSQKMADLESRERVSERERELAEAELALKKLEAEKPDRVDKNTLAIIAGNVAAVILVIGYERAHVVTTKALGFLMKR